MADELTPADFPQGELLFYTSKDGKVKMEIRVEDESIWMSQQMMAELFQTSKQNVAKHLKRIFEQGELQEESVVNQWLTTAADGKNYSVAYYNLDAIISVGYRVNSIRGTQFRIWATQQLSELMRKGFVLDKERLKNPPIKGATALPDYFDDLLEQYKAFAGYEGSKRNPVMMGVIAAKAHHPWIQGMMQTYENRQFVKEDGSLDMTPNTGYFLCWMQERGFVADGKEKDWMGVHILPVECFCPGLTTGENLRCEHTYCEHKGLHSWSGDGGWKNKLLGCIHPKMKTKLIKLKRIIIG
mgnify:CR=1 FL=1